MTIPSTPPTDAVDTRVTLVTGANKGIGRETARRLVEAGHRVYVGARDLARGRGAAEQIGARFVQLDVTSDDSVRHAADVVERDCGRLDVLVTNAGVTQPVRDVHDLDAEDATAVLLTNVVGCVRVVHAFLPMLERAADPQVVVVGSGLGSFGLFADDERVESRVPAPLYAASKAALNMLTLRYARMLPGIRFNVADPGMTATDLNGGHGHGVREGTDAIVALALSGPAGPTGTFSDRDGALPW